MSKPRQKTIAQYLRTVRAILLDFLHDEFATSRTTCDRDLLEQMGNCFPRRERGFIHRLIDRVFALRADATKAFEVARELVEYALDPRFALK
ncbi:MAG TPA: hypothetical protein PLB89_04685 [Flavobacteriales bacterium]|nr:hypothetical protein [Flavobacteriales bacterium]